MVGSDGQQIGILPLPRALALAREQDLDLVEVAPNADPPVVRIMDFGKWKYEAAQRARENRKKSKAASVSIKEMKYRPKIGRSDFDTKTRKVEKFLEEGHKVKITLQFRGREMAHQDVGRQVMARIVEELADVAKVERPARMEGRRMTLLLTRLK